MKEIKNRIVKFISFGPKSTFLLILLIIGCLSIIYNLRKEVTVIVDGEEKKIITYSSSLRNTLKRNAITVGPKDKITPGLDSKVKDGDKVIITRAVNINVIVDGKTLQIQTAEKNVEEMLVAEGITVNESDKVNPPRTQDIADGMTVKITRVTTQLLKESQNIEYSTEVRKDPDLASNVTKTIQEGQTGEREITTRVVYEDGKEVSREVISDVVTKEPVKKILLQGTLGVLALDRGGTQITYKSVIRVKATAYCPCNICTGKYSSSAGYNRTAMGTQAKRNANGYSTIAVDPRVIPLGTKVYVEDYGFAIAEDTGGAIKGNKIDVYFPSHSQALQWGVKYKNVYILK
ncbi:MAG: DUF348 domain-containing protein [Clostridiales bacterium]|uniref:3D domain-containing protein n=1 Tax=Clostridium sp. N3C TaxID=1776758 RepID=UPI00092DFB71|nr:3D domain-containing protein [Clostridium sp. N3C]NLZ47521.1 DUF348 domain-containing protein [Clostridiales bacterium]SCN23001.1 Cell wall-binding protein YocH precursor [Clostridium sp. N3C]